MNTSYPPHSPQPHHAPNPTADDFAPYALGQRTWHKPDRLAWYQKALALPAYHWILGTLLLVLCVHIVHIPWWLTCFGLISLVMQLPFTKSRLAKGSTRLKSYYYGCQLMGFVGGLAGIWLSFGQILGVDVSISFLVLCLFCKAWELFSRRDAYIVLNLGLFVLAAAFLWSQALALTSMVLLALIATLLGFIALSDNHNTTGAGRLRALGFLMLPALPLLVVLFLFFPRLPPLWTLNIPSNQATTGVSDSMSPGDFANLSQSTELAFRVEFEQTPPQRGQMYWRGMVFRDFDGITWRAGTMDNQKVWRSDTQLPAWADVFKGEPANRYRLILEPTYQNWLFALDYSRPQARRGIGMNDEFNLRSLRPISERFTYQLDYYPHAIIGQQLSPDDITANTTLPNTGNTQARQLAQQLYAKSNQDTKLYINAIYRYIQDNQFSYTLSPPMLQDNRIDEFLFNTRQGFCEHYASSFVFLMRAVGIPARVVAGYQGGEFGRDGKSWEVRQMDAHAWAEVWIDQQGWVRVDPTSFVAPDRIDNGMNNFSQMVGSSMFGDGMAAQFGYQQFRLLQQLRRYSDQVDYYWNRRVVGYDSDGQKNTLMSWFNIQNLTQQLMTMTAVLVLIAAMIGFVFWYRRRMIYHAFDLPIIKLSHTLGKKDIALRRQNHEGVLSYLQRLKTSKLTHTDNAKLDERIDKLSHLYRQYRFGQLSDDEGSPTYKKQAAQFAKQIKQLTRFF